jgi:hypothetical protein
LEEGATVQDTGQVQEKTREVTQQAKGQMREQVDQRSTQVGRQIGSAADDVRSVAEELRAQGKETPARYANQAAEKAQQAGEWLRDADGDQILRDVEDFARRKPWAIAAGGLALGFAASRLLKASSGERYRSSVSNVNGPGGQGRSLAGEPMQPGAATSGPRFEPAGPMHSSESRS